MPTDVIIDPSTGQIYWNDGTGSPQSIAIKGDALNTISFVGYGGSFSPGSSVGSTQVLVSINDSGGADALVPGSNAFDLGSSTLRWNTFATNANLSGTLVVSDSTISSSLLTGSVKFNGGIAISGNASIGQSLLLYGAGTAYTSYTGFKAGSVTANTLYTLPTAFPGAGTSFLQSDTSGTLSWIGAIGTATTATNINVVSATTSASHPVLFTPTFGNASGVAVSSNTTLVYNPNTDILSVSGLAITSGAISTSTTSGAFQVKGGIGITGNAFIGGTINLGSPLSIPNGGTNASSFGQTGGFIYYDGENIRLLAATGASINYSNGYYQFNNRVYASSFFASGSQMPNGSGIAGRVTIWSGNNTIGSDAEFTYDSTNNILNVSGNINAIGFTASGIAATSSLNATSKTSAAMVVTGGVGVGGTIFAGGLDITNTSTSPNASVVKITGAPRGNEAIFEVTSSDGGSLSVLNNFGSSYGVRFNLTPSGNSAPYAFNINNSSGQGIFSVDASNLIVSLQRGSAIRLYESGASNYAGFRFAGSADTTYTLPSRTPTGTATSYLSSGIDGVMAWVAAPTSGGSGSVSSGTATYAAFYASTTNAVSENANLQFTGTGVSIGGRINSTSTTSGSFYVYGGVGITGNAFIGGTAYIPSTTPSNISNLLVSNNTSSTSTSSGTLVINGGVGIAGNAFIGGTFVHQSTTSSVGTNSGSVTLAGGTFKYPGGSVTRTTASGAIDIWFFFTPDGGTTYYASIPMANLS
jgi:hypothetical protein